MTALIPVLPREAAAARGSQYSAPLERCANGVDHPLSGPNPILSEPLTTAFTSNLPLSEYVTFSGDQREAKPGGTFTYTFGGTPGGGLTLEQIRDSLRFTGDLNLSANQSMVVHYGTNRLTN